MTYTAKLFYNGRSQAVRIPSAYKFDTQEVYIRRNPETGDIILSKKPGDWQTFFKFIENIEIPQDFLQERDNTPPQHRDLL